MSATRTHTDSAGIASAETETIFLSPRVLDEAAFERFNGTLRELLDRAKQERSVLEAMVRSAETAGPRMERLAESQRQALRAAGDAGRRNEEVRTLLSALDARLEETRRAERDLDARGKSVREVVDRADATLARCESILQRIEQIKAPTDDLARTAALADQARRALDDAASRALEIVHRAEEASREFLRLTQDVAEPLAMERTQAGQATIELRGAIDQWRSLVERGSRSAHALQSALTELESWRGVLIDSHHQAMLPPALQSMLDELRAGVMRDIGEMARAMRAVAERTVAPERRTAAVSVEPRIVTRPAAPLPLSGIEFLISGAD